MSDRRLNVYLDGASVGELTLSDAGSLAFEYRPEYAEDPATTPLSVSMPKAIHRHRQKAVDPYLRGLLPDSPDRLELLAGEFHTSTHPFRLLSHIGRDAAGAVQILPRGKDSDDAAERRGDVQRHSAAEFDEIIGDIVDQAAVWGRKEPNLHWSLPGAQPKVAMFRFADGAFGSPRDSTPTNYILKPAVPPYTHHDINEVVTMEAARILGLGVAEHEVIETASGHRVFASRRYDRAQGADGVWRRLHQEDFCQAMSVAPKNKYQTDGGPSIAKIAIMLRQSIPDVADREAAQRSFFEALVFNVTVGGTDAHAKNYSLMLDGGRVSMAPLYDLGTHAPYPTLDNEPLRSAMSVDGEWALDRISEQHLLGAARRLDLDRDWAHERIADIRGHFVEAFAEAAGGIRDPFAVELVDAVAAIADSRGWPGRGGAG